MCTEWVQDIKAERTAEKEIEVEAKDREDPALTGGQGTGRARAAVPRYPFIFAARVQLVQK